MQNPIPARLRTYRVLAMLWGILVLLGALMPGHDKHTLLDPFPAALHMDKAGHMVGFFGLAFFAMRSRFRAIGARGVIMIAVALAVGTELGQSFVPGRTPSGIDVLIDTAAACIGLLLAMYLGSRPTAAAVDSWKK